MACFKGAHNTTLSFVFFTFLWFSSSFSFSLYLLFCLPFSLILSSLLFSSCHPTFRLFTCPSISHLRSSLFLLLFPFILFLLFLSSPSSPLHTTISLPSTLILILIPISPFSLYHTLSLTPSSPLRNGSIVLL